TGELYVLVGSTIRLPASPGETAKSALVQGWVVAQDVLRMTGERLVGWYRGEENEENNGGGEAGGSEESDPDEVSLVMAETEAHAALFPQLWQLALKAGARRGGLFRPAAGGLWARRSLQVYEGVDPSCVGVDGNTVRSLQWDNYRADQSVATP